MNNLFLQKSPFRLQLCFRKWEITEEKFATRKSPDISESSSNTTIKFRMKRISLIIQIFKSIRSSEQLNHEYMGKSATSSIINLVSGVIFITTNWTDLFWNESRDTLFYFKCRCGKTLYSRFVMYVRAVINFYCISTKMILRCVCHHGNHWTDFIEVWYWWILQNLLTRLISFLLKTDTFQ